MGILNTTPDSFSDGGRFVSAATAEDRARAMLESGADIIDVGGESTRPGAKSVSAAEEMKRVLPVIEALAEDRNTVISVDTSKAAVALEAVRMGACIINDVTAMGGDPGMAGVVRDTGAGVVLMHMQGTPHNMQQQPHYDHVVEDIFCWLADRMRNAAKAGIDRQAVVVDPGIGFGKTLAHNLDLLAQLDRFASLDRPLLVGLSRKRFVGELTGEPVADRRLPGSLAALSCAILKGAHILRVHDVHESMQAARLAAAIRTPALAGVLTTEVTA